MNRFLSDAERGTLEAVAQLADLNPFLLDARTELERRVLGDAFESEQTLSAEPAREQLQQCAEKLADELRARLVAGARASTPELAAYEALVRYALFGRYQHVFTELIERGERGEPTTGRIQEYRQYRRDVAHYLEMPGVRMPGAVPAAQLFAWGFQIRRAFYHTYRQIHGSSRPASLLRAAVWQSIFTHDIDRYRRVMYARMGDITTLILGESGTGKELVARAIGLSRYVSFDEERLCFTHDASADFHPVNLSALASNLIESELFGHRKGAFTGAQSDHAGWLEICSEAGTVFLDEIGELDATLQVKLLRVLQERRFHRVGDTVERSFTGKIVAATNRALQEELAAGAFRSDFYYRLCADVIRTPSLREQLADAPGDLRLLVGRLCARIVGEDEADSLAHEVVGFIERELGPDYAWPGNVRELEQCVRNVLVRGEYRPERSVGAPGARELARILEEGALTADAVLRRYCTLVYARTGSYEEAARRLELDRRTVKARIDPEELARIRGSGQAG